MMETNKRLCSTSICFAFVVVLLLETTGAAYLSTKCGFHGPDYSVKWAFEPQTRSVVFVLKTVPPANFSEQGMFVTGLAFETEEHNEFIGVAIAQKGDEMRIVGGKAAAGGGPFELNAEGTTSSNNLREISLKRRRNGDVIAEFARPLTKEEEEKGLLSGCKTFQFPTHWTWIAPGTSTFSPPTKQRKICELAENCLLDVQALTKKTMHRDAPPADIAQSVDVSGQGDPCSFKSDGYDVRWMYDSDTASVNFVLKQKPKTGKWWSAIGIGDNMSDMDIGVVFLNDGVPEEMNDYYSNSYGVPEKDASQDWKFDKSGSKWDDELVELHFSRQLVTEDTEKDRSLDGCVLFQFTANGGSYGDGYHIHKHESWPDLYKACNLKKRCVKPKDESIERTDRNSENVRPEISHSNDGGLKKGDERGDKVISLLMRALGPKIVQTVAESEEQIGKNNSTGTTKTAHENEKGERVQRAQIGSLNQQIEVELKPLTKRDEDVAGTANINAVTNYTSGENKTGETFTNSSATIQQPATGGDGGAQQPATGGDGGGQQPATGGGGGGQQPATGGGGAGQQPATGGGGAGQQPVTGGGGGAQQPATGGGGAAQQPATGESGAAQQPATGVGQQLATGGEPATSEGGVGQQLATGGGGGSPFSLNAFLGNQTDGSNLSPVGESVTGQNGTTIKEQEAKFGISQLIGDGEKEGGSNDTTSANAATTLANATTTLANETATLANEVVLPNANETKNETAEESITTADNNGTSVSSIPSTGGQVEAVEQGSPIERENVLTNNTISTPPLENNNSNETLFENITNTTNAENGTGTTTTTQTAETTVETTQNSTETTSALKAESSTLSTTEAETVQTVNSQTSNETMSTSTVTDQQSPSENGTTAKIEETTETTKTTTTPTSTLSTASSSITTSGDGGENTTIANAHQSTNGTDETTRPTITSSPISSPSLTTANATNGGAEQHNNTSDAHKSPSSVKENGEEQFIKLPVARSKCDTLRPDLTICKSYMDSYLGRVREWANKHGEPMEDQFGKACKLLAAVPHVPTLCCQILDENCSGHL